MKLTFTKKLLSSLILSVMLIAILTVAGYFVFVTRKQQVMQQAETQLETDKKMLAILQENNETAEEEKRQIENTTELQCKLPVEPLLDQLILDFQRVEALSETYILNITFQHDLPFSKTDDVEEEEPVQKQEAEVKEEGIKKNYR